MAKLTRSRLPQDDAQENFEQDGSGFEESADDIAPEEFPGNDRYEEIKRSDIHIAELQRLTMKELLLLARNRGRVLTHSQSCNARSERARPNG